MREGIPTVRVRTFDQEGNPTGEIILDPDTTKHVAANLPVALEWLGMVIDATGGVHHGGSNRVGTEDGSVEISWTPSGRFDDLMP